MYHSTPLHFHHSPIVFKQSHRPGHQQAALPPSSRPLLSSRLRAALLTSNTPSRRPHFLSSCISYFIVNRILNPAPDRSAMSHVRPLPSASQTTQNPFDFSIIRVHTPTRSSYCLILRLPPGCVPRPPQAPVIRLRRSQPLRAGVQSTAHDQPSTLLVPHRN